MEVVGEDDERKSDQINQNMHIILTLHHLHMFGLYE